MHKSNTMIENKKIADLFEYRLLPDLINTISDDQKEGLLDKLYALQTAIYKLDEYLETNWDLSEKKLDKAWQKIYKQLKKLGFEEESAESLCKHIERYQKHEIQLRDGKLPTSINQEYYYYYKSCDVRLMRQIIYELNPELVKKISLADWRIYDLVTEINDDIEDVFEDQKTINGNAFLIRIIEEDLEMAHDYFDKWLDELYLRSVQRFGNSKIFSKIELHYFTLLRINETKTLLSNVSKRIRKKGLKKKITLFENLKEK